MATEHKKNKQRLGSKKRKSVMDFLPYTIEKLKQLKAFIIQTKYFRGMSKNKTSK